MGPEKGPLKRGLRDTNFLQNLENNWFQDHKPARQEAVQCGINQGEPKRVVRYRETMTKGSMGPCSAETSRTPS